MEGRFRWSAWTNTTAAERNHAPIRGGLIALTINEFRRLLDALLLATNHNITSLLAWSTMATTTSIPSPPIPHRRRENQ
jgi:hypothetical protein